MRADVRFFLKWNASPLSAFESMIFYSRKLFFRLFKQERTFGIMNYPDRLRRLSRELGPHKVQRSPLTSLLTLGNASSVDCQVLILPLASRTLMLKHDGSIDWGYAYDDPEDKESLHRFKWAAHLLMMRDIPDSEKISWLLRQFKGWLDAQSGKEQRGLAWQSYTVAERISNIASFLHLLSFEIPVDIGQELLSQALYLLPRLEFYPTGYGNHVVNNARGILIAGTLTGRSDLVRFAIAVLEDCLPSLLSRQGFLKEGSSHYQYIFTRWLLDMHYFSRLKGFTLSERYLKRVIPACVSACAFFEVRAHDERQASIPLFGDVSPDFSPQFMLELPRSCLAKLLTVDGEEKVFSGWAELAEAWGEPKLDKDNRPSIDERNPWVKLQIGQAKVYLHAPATSLPREFTHQHNDFFSFCYYRSGKGILVDTGRSGYSDTPLNRNSVAAVAHNSLRINGHSETPESWRIMPRGFSRAKRETVYSLVEDQGIVRLRTDGFKRIGVQEVTRRLRICGDRLEVCDEIVSDRKSIRVQAYFHFAEHFDVQALNSKQFRIKSSDISGILTISGDDLEVECYLGASDAHPGLGYLAKEYGRVLPARTLVIEYQWPRTKPNYNFEWKDATCVE